MANTIRCIIVDDEPVAREIMESHLSKIDSIDMVATCKNAIEAFNVINLKAIDLIFLDINMPEISGLSFAKSLKKDIKIIFTTAYREYALDGFDLQAVDYLLKPISFERLLQAVGKYLNENVPVVLQTPKEILVERDDHFFIRIDRKMVKISLNDILYIESLNDNIRIHLTRETLVTREAMVNIEAKLPQTNFIRTHRSFIVSKQKIESFTNEFIEIENRQIPISRSYKNKVLNRLKS